jgi:hypothetical protein
MCEHEEPWCNDIGREKSNSSTRALWQSCQQSNLKANQKEKKNLAFEIPLFIVESYFYTP